MARKKKLKFDFTPSEYQEKIFNFIVNGEGNAVISAYAGAGKSFTILNAMKLIPSKEKAIFIAFNKSIADELNEKLKSQPNASAFTSHSLGYKMIRRNLGSNNTIDEYKYRSYVKNNIAELSGFEDGEVNINKNQTVEYIDNITHLIDYSRLFLCNTAEDIDNIAKRYDIPIIANECEVTLKCLEWGKNNTSSIDYADMLWLPTALDLQPMGMTYDWVFVDEAQDSSKATISLFKKCVKENGRWICVGDEKQTVNLFAGSCEENFNQLCQEPNTQVFKLPISYRCGRQIIKAAQSIVPDILPKFDAIEGEVRENCHLRDLKDGDMVLARSKAPLLTIYSKLIKKGISCYIKGIDIGTNLIGLLDEVKGTKLNKSLSEDGVFVQLYDRLFNERNKLVLNRGLDIDDATLSSYILEKYDIIKALEIIAYDVKTKSELKNKIREIFKEDSKGVCISTIHKSKGLEADNVYIVCHSSMPSKNCHHEWEKIQEKNLVYVAYTRAKKVLGFISEKEIPPSGSTSDSESILNELNNIENIVCGLLGKPTFNGTNSVEAVKARIKKIEKVEIPKKKTKKKIRSVANKKDSNNKLLSDLDSLI
jgi:DNA helicase II / ATP-dependent DNA helicase PcrA